MGHLIYDGEEIEIEDRTLSHLHIVIMQKLRRNESFVMSWVLSSDVGGGRASLWLHPAIPLRFKFNGSRVPAINPVWFAELMESANSSHGLIITPENASATGSVPAQPPRQRIKPPLEPAQLA